MISKGAYGMMVILISLVALTTWLALRIEKPVVPPKHSFLPSAIVKGITVKQMNDRGSLYYQLQAQSAIQFDGDLINLESPAGLVYSTAAIKPWHFQSQQGKINQQNTLITLENDVVITHDADKKLPALTLNTNYLLINTHDKTISTPNPVKLTEPGTGNIVTAVGMTGSLVSHLIKLLSKVNSYYEPTKTTS